MAIALLLFSTTGFSQESAAPSQTVQEIQSGSASADTNVSIQNSASDQERPIDSTSANLNESKLGETAEPLSAVVNQSNKPCADRGLYSFFITGPAGISPSAVLKVNASPKTKLMVVAQAAGPSLREDNSGLTAMYGTYECVQYSLSINGVTFKTEMLTPFPKNPYCPDSKSQSEVDLAALGLSKFSGPLTVEVVEVKTNSRCRNLPIYDYHNAFDGAGVSNKTSFIERYCPVGEVDSNAQVGVGLLVL